MASRGRTSLLAVLNDDWSRSRFTTVTTQTETGRGGVTRPGPNRNAGGQARLRHSRTRILSKTRGRTHIDCRKCRAQTRITMRHERTCCCRGTRSVFDHHWCVDPCSKRVTSTKPITEEATRAQRQRQPHPRRLVSSLAWLSVLSVTTTIVMMMVGHSSSPIQGQQSSSMERQLQHRMDLPIHP